MSYVKLNHNGRSYSYDGSDDVTMDIIGLFLSSDAGYYSDVYKEWALNPTKLKANGNITALEKEENNTIALTDMYNQTSHPALIILTTNQFVQLIDEWQEKVCKHIPKDVVIRYENDQFIIETTK